MSVFFRHFADFQKNVRSRIRNYKIYMVSYGIDKGSGRTLWV